LRGAFLSTFYQLLLVRRVGGEMLARAFLVADAAL